MTGEHYFTPTPGAEVRTAVRVRLPVLGEVEVLTAAGVFSAGRLDPGTAVLLDHLPDLPEQPDLPSRPEPDLLDLGCGWGPIALVMAALRPEATVWAVDVNERARALTAENAARLGLGGVRVAAPEEVPQRVGFSAIWSNPPIRVGKQALHGLLESWLGRLADDGQAHLVVQRHLGADSLAGWLAEQGWQVGRAASSKGYRVLRVAR